LCYDVCNTFFKMKSIVQELVSKSRYRYRHWYLKCFNDTQPYRQVANVLADTFQTPDEYVGGLRLNSDFRQLLRWYQSSPRECLLLR